jgi:hypothetical protein
MLGKTQLRRFRASSRSDYAGCLPSLRGSGPRHDGARSAGVKVLCEVRSTEVRSGAILVPATRRDGGFDTVPVSCGASASVNTS